MSYKTKEQNAEYMRQYLNNKRQQWVIKQGHKCNQCGDNQGPFDIDHIDRTQKSYHISRIWSRSKQTLEAELSKCQLLCKPCHKAKTKAELTKQDVQHGTTTMYNHRGCRCQECREWNANRVRTWRSK